VVYPAEDRTANNSRRPVVSKPPASAVRCLLEPIETNGRLARTKQETACRGAECGDRKRLSLCGRHRASRASISSVAVIHQFQLAAAARIPPTSTITICASGTTFSSLFDGMFRLFSSRRHTSSSPTRCFAYHLAFVLRPYSTWFRGRTTISVEVRHLMPNLRVPG
jgi:hypothetical protein